ncbi:protein FAR1-RELATED SEQUENCE 5-like, partial [Apium graveolens]|uniref:protein FAR1-RELATED SEQUENCE 5-like n=1 Tax=Apium graveolens TaxID=4045 RepID=UPI003D78D078
SFCGDSFRSGNDVGISIFTDLSSTESESSVRNYTISPGGNRYYIPNCVVENDMPYTNQVFESVDQGYRFYKAYARLGGFSVRKTTEKTNNVGTVMLKHYVCSCEGFNNPKDDPKVLKKRRLVTRHYFLRSSREMTTSLRNICYNGAKVNIGVSKSFSFFEGNMMIDKLKRMQEKSEGFYYAYEVDSEGRLTKLFRADSIGHRNFELYGDTISFDATFDTNMYNLFFAPFTGVDKNDRCVIFASFLLSHESVADYSWAFGHLVKAMGRNPILIITDQCPAMKVFVRDVFSDVNGLVLSKHRLCLWHIMEKFPVKKWANVGLLRTTSRSESENSFFGQFHKQGDTLCEFW